MAEGLPLLTKPQGLNGARSSAIRALLQKNCGPESIHYKCRMIRLTDEQWERIRMHFPEEHIPDGRPGANPSRHVAFLKQSCGFSTRARNVALSSHSQSGYGWYRRLMSAPSGPHVKRSAPLIFDRSLVPKRLSAKSSTKLPISLSASTAIV